MKKRFRASRGTALVEFALCLPLLTILVLGTIDGARLYATWTKTKQAAQQGANFAQYYPLRQAPSGSSCANPDNIQARARNEGSDLTVTVSPAVIPACQDLSAGSVIQSGQTVTVTVSAPFAFVTPFAQTLWGSPVVKSSARITVQG